MRILRPSHLHLHLVRRLFGGVLCCLLTLTCATGLAARGHRPEELVGTLNLNTATLEQLKLLPGIGEGWAKRILAQREKRPFTNIAEIRRIRGLGPKRFLRIRPFLRVSGDSTLAPAPAVTPAPVPAGASDTVRSSPAGSGAAPATTASAPPAGAGLALLMQKVLGAAPPSAGTGLTTTPSSNAMTGAESVGASSRPVINAAAGAEGGTLATSQPGRIPANSRPPTIRTVSSQESINLPLREPRQPCAPGARPTATTSPISGLPDSLLPLLRLPFPLL